MIKAQDKSRIVSIVDDDESVLIAIHSLVSSFGFEAFTFPSAEAFLQSPRLNNTSCLISDVHMANMSGIELQRVLLGRGLKIPIVFMTAFSNESIRARAVAAGAVCFLMKPLDTNTLIECINAALEHDLDDGDESPRC
jgi:FixJ family two-component response regulator